ncbi:MAG: hypothetical protein NXI12_11275 [Alphaproteobacteria bacterium]|nr:hypothetical protein [Alphaproteobacteria bacterium]
MSDDIALTGADTPVRRAYVAPSTTIRSTRRLLASPRNAGAKAESPLS